MVSKQYGLTVFYVVLNATIIFCMLKEIYIYLILALMIFLSFKRLKSKMAETIDIPGKAVLVTGCDTGFGFDLARQLNLLGFTVYAGCLLPQGDGAGMLRKKNNPRLHVLHLDVTNESLIAKAVKYIESQHAGLWAVVNNAAIRRDIDIELIPLELMKKVYDVNFYGMVRVTKAFIPMLRQSKGRIVNVTSVNGLFAVPQAVSYTVSKYAAEAFSDILRREMHKFDVRVVIIEPSHFGGSTAMLNKRDCDHIEQELNSFWKTYSPEIQDLYGWNYTKQFIKACRDDGVDGCHSTTAVIASMIDGVSSKSPNYRYLVHGSNGWVDIWAIVAILERFLPEKLMDWLLRRLIPSTELSVKTK